jgi:hypothetical protein
MIKQLNVRHQSNQEFSQAARSSETGRSIDQFSQLVLEIFDKLLAVNYLIALLGAI